MRERHRRELGTGGRDLARRLAEQEAWTRELEAENARLRAENARLAAAAGEAPLAEAEERPEPEAAAVEAAGRLSE